MVLRVQSKSSPTDLPCHADRKLPPTSLGPGIATLKPGAMAADTGGVGDFLAAEGLGFTEDAAPYGLRRCGFGYRLGQDQGDGSHPGHRAGKDQTRAFPLPAFQLLHGAPIGWKAWTLTRISAPSRTR